MKRIHRMSRFARSRSWANFWAKSWNYPFAVWAVGEYLFRRGKSIVIRPRVGFDRILMRHNYLTINIL